jgi:hypothetical protein
LFVAAFDAIEIIPAFGSTLPGLIRAGTPFQQPGRLEDSVLDKKAE